MKNVVNIKFLRAGFFFQKIKATFHSFEIFLLEKKVCSQIYINLELYENVTYSPLLLKETCVYYLFTVFLLKA